MELWYYTREGKQMEPVTATELSHLAASGFLRPSDLVWKDGMSEWVKASSLDHLFPGGAIETHSYEAAHVFQPALADALPTPFADDDFPRRRREEYDRPAPRRKRLNEPDEEPAKGTSGLKIGMIVGSLIILLMVGAGALAYFLSAPRILVAEYEVALDPNEAKWRDVEFQRGTLYEIRVTSDRDTDVDLHLDDAHGEAVAHDVSAFKDCYLRWSPEVSGRYRVRVVNLAEDELRRDRNRSTVTIHSIGRSRVPVGNLPMHERFHPGWPLPPLPDVDPKK